MTKDEAQFMQLGREIVRMIRDLNQVAREETGYARKRFTFPGGAVHIFIANSDGLADVIERAAKNRYNVQDAIPPSTKD